MSIAESMKRLIESCKTRFKDYRVPLAPECEDAWSDDYAIVDGYYFEPRGFEPEGEYVEINYNRRRDDFESLIRDCFGPSVVIVAGGYDPPIEPGKAVVRLMEGSQEIEAYRQKGPQ